MTPGSLLILPPSSLMQPLCTQYLQGLSTSVSQLWGTWHSKELQPPVLPEAKGTWNLPWRWKVRNGWVAASVKTEHWISAKALWLLAEIRTKTMAFPHYQGYISILTDGSSFSSLFHLLYRVNYLCLHFCFGHLLQIWGKMYTNWKSWTEHWPLGRQWACSQFHWDGWSVLSRKKIVDPKG